MRKGFLVSPTSKKKKGADKENQKAISKDVFRSVLKTVNDNLGSKDCSRCGKRCDQGGPCRVPHPQHLVSDAMTSFKPNGDIVATKYCAACFREFTVVTSRHDLRTIRVEMGPEFCYEAEQHDPMPLPAHDQRRIWADMVSIVATSDEDIQEKLRALDGKKGIKKLVLLQDDGAFNQVKFELCPDLPDLESLIMHDLNPSLIRLTRENVPKLTKCDIRNLPNSCDLTLDLPKLKEFTIQFFAPEPHNEEAFNDCLFNASELESFDSYKLWNDELRLCSNHLTNVNIRRSDGMQRIEIWAPKLENLNLVACYNLEEIDILKKPPSDSLLVDTATFDPCSFTKFDVNIENSLVSPEAEKALEKCSRVRNLYGAESPDDEYDGPGFSSTDSMQRAISRAMQQNGGGLEGIAQFMEEQSRRAGSYMDNLQQDDDDW